MNELSGGYCVLLLRINRLDYSIDVSLSNAFFPRIVLLKENELNASLIAKEMNENFAWPNSRVSLLKSF